MGGKPHLALLRDRGKLNWGGKFGLPLIILLLWGVSFGFLFGNGGKAAGDVVFEEVQAKDRGASRQINFLEYYSRVIAHYPILKSRHAEIEKAIAEKFQAYAGFFPSVQGVASVTTTDNPGLVLNTLLRQNSLSNRDLTVSNLNNPEPRTNFNFSLHGEIPLFNAFQTISQIRMTRHLVASERLQEELVRAEAALLALEAYLNVMVKRNIVRRIQEVIKESLADIQQAEDLKAKGLILGADFYAARVIHSGMKQLENQSIFDLQKAHILFNILMGEDPQREYEPVGSLPEPRKKIQPFRNWLQRAYQKRWDLLALEEQIRSRKAAVFGAKTSILPRVSAFAELHEDSHDLRSGGESYIAGFKGTMPLLDPTYLGRLKKARAVLKKVEAEKLVLRDAIGSQLAGEFSRHEALHSNLSVVRNMFQDAREAVSLTQPLYREGRKSIADLLEMRKAYLDVGIRLDELLARSEASYARLSFLSGGLGESEIHEVAHRIEWKGQ